MNGWGYSAGLVVGMLTAFFSLYVPQLQAIDSFLICTISSSLASVFVSYLSPPVPKEILIKFYQSVRPFGFWKEVRLKVSQQTTQPSETLALSAINVCLAIVVIAGLYLGPMYFVAQWYQAAIIFVCFSGCAAIGLYFTWYRKIVQRWELYLDGTQQPTTSKLYTERVSDFT
ncbi:MAG: hypothetical protein AB8G05_16480 [Oligoflexales bacterium]